MGPWPCGIHLTQSTDGQLNPAGQTLMQLSTLLTMIAVLGSIGGGIALMLYLVITQKESKS
jgi:hypothetical protein